MSTLSIFAPAKLNLFLAITGRRADGFHELVSVVAQLDFGDLLHAEPAAEFSLACDATDVPLDESNLVLKAAAAFRRETNWAGGARFRLEKRVPVGAGLGGGSSDAVAALRACNELAGRPLKPADLSRLAAQLGSDCALFLHEGPVVMRGRGERITGLPPAVAARLRGRRVLLFKPGFSIATPWAYAQLAADPATNYLPATAAELRLNAWFQADEAAAEDLLLNTMEPPAFAKFPALPLLLQRLRTEFGLQARMSGSGSACFAFLRDDAPGPAIAAMIRGAWGESAFVTEARLT